MSRLVSACLAMCYGTLTQIKARSFAVGAQSSFNVKSKIVSAMVSTRARLRRWQNQMSLLPQPGCEKAHGSAAPCRVCPPLFPKVVKGPWDPSTQQRPQAVSAQMVSDAVKATLGYVGIDPTGFCGRSMRIGALTAGVIAGTPEAVLYLQTGHGQFKAGRVYMHDFSAATLYATSRALGL